MSSYKQQINDLAKDNVHLKDRLYGIDCALETRNKMVATIASLITKLEKVSDPEAMEWWYIRINTLHQASQYIERIVFEMESIERANTKLSELNGQLLDKVSEQERIIDSLMNDPKINTPNNL